MDDFNKIPFGAFIRYIGKPNEYFLYGHWYKRKKPSKPWEYIEGKSIYEYDEKCRNMICNYIGECAIGLNMISDKYYDGHRGATYTGLKDCKNNWDIENWLSSYKKPDIELKEKSSHWKIIGTNFKIYPHELYTYIDEKDIHRKYDILKSINLVVKSSDSEWIFFRDYSMIYPLPEPGYENDFILVEKTPSKPLKYYEVKWISNE